MPTHSELVSNKPLAGSELAKILRADIDKMLASDPMLGALIAYGRISYEVRVTLHMDNYSYPTHMTSVHSRAAAKDQPHLAALESGLPLRNASPTSLVSATETYRDITSPNVSRIEHGLPIEIIRRGDGGTTQSESVLYPPEMADAKGPPPIITDYSDQTRKEFALPSLITCHCTGPISISLEGTCATCGGVLEFEMDAADALAADTGAL